MFRTQYNRIRVNSNPGERFHSTYELFVDEKGRQELKVTGRIDIYEQIQSWKDSCDIRVIKERFENGDTSVLNRKVPLFGDFTSAPASLAEFQQHMIEAEKMFNGLPVETRAKFNHSVSEFIASFGSPAWLELMGIRTSEPNSNPIEGASDNEEKPEV